MDQTRLLGALLCLGGLSVTPTDAVKAASEGSALFGPDEQLAGRLEAQWKELKKQPE